MSTIDRNRVNSALPRLRTCSLNRRGQTQVSDREHEIRSRRLVFETLLEQRRLTAAVIASEDNFFYLTGYRTPSWALPGRPMFLLIRPGSPPLAIVNAAESDRIEALAVDVEPLANTAPERGEETPEGLDFGATAVNQLLKLVGSGAALGLELGAQMIPTLAPAVLDRIRESSRASTDVSSLLWQLRLIKSDAEIAALRRSEDALEAATSRRCRRPHRRILGRPRPPVRRVKPFAPTTGRLRKTRLGDESRPG